MSIRPFLCKEIIMAQATNLIGKKFGRLKVIKALGNDQYETICICNNTKIVYGNNLLSGDTTSCGCRRREVTAQRNRERATHSMSRTLLYGVWFGIKQRCDDSKNPHYGGRGIKMCKEWKLSSKAFLTWAIKNGYRKGLQIDRIDNNGDYEPKNCRWVTAKENQNNRGNALKYEAFGEKKNLTQWINDPRNVNRSLQALRHRLSKGMPLEIALTKPVGSFLKWKS